MPHALIAGCGYVGKATAELLRASGWEVTGWVRNERAPDCHSALKAVDLSDHAAVLRESFAADLVIHCASSGGGTVEDYRATYLTGASNLIAAFPSTRLIFTSSTSVYAQKDGEWVTEEGPSDPKTETGKILRAAEEEILNAHGIVLRLAGIYGPSRSALLRIVRENKPVALEPDRWVNQIHRDDIAAAILLLAQKRDQPSAIFNVADNAPTLRSEILHWLSRRLQRPLNISPRETVPRRRGESNKRVSNSHLRELGWKPQFPDFRTAFERSILTSES